MNGPAYLDASAIVKLAVPETESLALVDYLDEPRLCITSALSLTEVTRGLRRADPARETPEAVLDAFHLVEIDAAILRRAGRLTPASLRALDAIHLASALSLDLGDLDFVTYDDRLAIAARAHGLRVVQPGR